MPSIQAVSATGDPVQLHYVDEGEGRPIVLLHGWPLSHRMWAPQISALTSVGFRVIAYDRRGFGESDKPSEGYDYDTLAADLNTLLESLDIEDATLVGFSMGGGELARYLSRYGSQRVSRAVFVSAVTPYLMKAPDNEDGVDPKVFDDMLREIFNDRRNFLDGFTQRFVNWDVLPRPVSEELIEEYKAIAAAASPSATAQCIHSFSSTDFRADLARITVPTLFIHGDKDEIVPLEASAPRAVHLTPGARLEVISGAPHGLHVTHGKTLNRLITEFVSEWCWRFDARVAAVPELAVEA